MKNKNEMKIKSIKVVKSTRDFDRLQEYYQQRFDNGPWTKRKSFGGNHQVFFRYIKRQIDELIEECQCSPREILVVFDWDETLYARYGHYERLRFINEIRKKHKIRIPGEPEGRFFTFDHGRGVLLPHTRPLLTYLYERGFPVIILTRRDSKEGVEETLVKEKLSHCVDKVIHRSWVMEIDPRSRKTLNVGLEKGPTLKKYFQLNKEFPKGVVFVDDLVSNLESVETSMFLMGIKCRPVDAKWLNYRCGYYI